MTDMQTVTPIGDVVDGYFAAWNETDPQRRRAAVAATWAREADYIDPQFEAVGHEALDALAVAVHEKYPGYRFRLTGAVDAHHDRARWGWEFGDPNGGTPVVTGVDFAVLAPDGRLRSVTGFFAQPGGAA